MPRTPTARAEHEHELKKSLPKFWAPGGMYHEVERNRQPFLRAMKGGIGEAYRQLLPKRGGEFLPDNGKILVPGAGEGFEREVLPAEVPTSKIVFCDLGEAQVKALRGRHPGANAAAGSSFDLPFKSGRFSAVTSMDHLDVFEEGHLTQVVGEFKRVLKPGGVMLVTQSSMPSLHWTPHEEEIMKILERGDELPDELLEDVHKRYTNAVMAEMKAQGFVNVKMEPVRGIYVGPKEGRHLERLPKIVAPGMLPALVADRGSAGKMFLDASHLKKLGIPPLSQLKAVHKDPVAEIFMSYVIHGKKPETEKKG